MSSKTRNNVEGFWLNKLFVRLCLRNSVKLDILYKGNSRTLASYALIRLLEY